MAHDTLKVTNFFGDEYVNQASYDNLRKIASLVDGQKNAARKVLHTVLQQNIKTKTKVSILNSKMAEFTEYLHGDASGVISNLGQKHVGTNNVPLLFASGNFGTRFVPEPSAPRYIYTYGTDDFFELFKKVDCNILHRQFFEGVEIEPVFFVPTLPILLINGSEGVSSGFAQKILPRDPKQIKRYIKGSLNGKKSRADLTPSYKGFNGTVENGVSQSQWKIKGAFTRTGVNKILITELPIGYTLKGYLKVLDDLEDNKVIQRYRDKSEDDVFLFEVNIASKVLKQWTDDDIFTKLKLVQTVTENYTAMDENNKIFVCDNSSDLLDKYIEVKLDHVEKRKMFLLPEMEENIRLDFSKYLFIKMIVDGELIVARRKKAQIETDLDNVETIIKKGGNYDYLLNMAIQSLTEERMAKLQQDIKTQKSELDKLSKSTPTEIWLEEL